MTSSTLTYEDLRTALKREGAKMVAYRDSTTPLGTFAVTTQVLGVTTTYLFLGEEREPVTAKCLGRVEVGRAACSLAYRGGRLKGGVYLGSRLTYSVAFARFLMETDLFANANQAVHP